MAKPEAAKQPAVAGRQSPTAVRSGTPRHAAAGAGLVPAQSRSGATAARTRVGRGRWLFANAVPMALVLVGLLFAFWQLAHVRGYTYGDWQGNPSNKWSDYDEGVYVVSGRLLNNGYAIFSQVFSSQPPLFLGGLALALRLAGGAAGAGHVYSLAFGLLALAGVAWLCWETQGRWSALLAVTVLALSPGFVIAAHAVEAEAPMLGFGSLSVAAAARYSRTSSRLWLTAAGLLLSAATLSKLLAVFIAAPIGVAILLVAITQGRSGYRSRLLTDVALCAACVAVPIAVAFVALSPPQQFDQVITFHLKASSAYPAMLRANPATPSNLDQFETLLGWDPGLLALSLIGIAVATVRRNRQMLIPFTWLVAAAAPLFNYHPLFVHHLTVLLPALAALAGGALAGSTQKDQGGWVVGRLRVGVVGILAGAGLLVYAIWLPAITQHSSSVLVPDRTPYKAARVAWLEVHSGPQDLVVVDDQTLAVAANRLVPPMLSDTSIVRATAGYLPLSLLEQATDPSQVHAILLTRALQYAPGYVPWLRRHYRQVRVSALHGLAFESLSGVP